MRPPRWVCRALYDLHPQLRLAWQGRPPSRPGELNAGSFAIVQLYHVRDAGNPDDPTTFRELWSTTIAPNEHGHAVRVRSDRGPLFNKNAETSPDWDPLQRVPVFVMTIDESYSHPDGAPLTTRDVYTGRFLEAIKASFGDIRDRVQRSKDAMAKDLSNRCEDMGREMADELWWESKKPEHTSDNTIAYKHVKHQIARHDHYKHLWK